MWGLVVSGKPVRRHMLSKRDLRALASEASESLPGVEIPRGGVELVEYRDYSLYLLDGSPFLARVKGRLIPHLKWLLRNGVGELPRLRVDPGATRALARGADLMVPGIISVEGEFEEGSIVVVVDDRYNAPIAVGVALMSSSEIKRRLEGERRGKAVKILHRPGDDIW